MRTIRSFEWAAAPRKVVTQMNLFDKSRCEQMEPTPSRVPVLALSIMRDGTLRLNEKLMEDLSTRTVCIWVDGSQKLLYLEKAAENTPKVCLISKNGQLRSESTMKALKKYGVAIPARFEVFDHDEDAWALRYHPEHTFETPMPKGKRLTQPRKNGLDKMLS